MAYVHTMRRGSGWWPGAGLIAFLGTTVLAPIVYVAFALDLRLGRTRYYFSPSRDADLSISVSKHGWRVGNRLSARPGEGQGRALRAIVLPELVSFAEDHRITVFATAATQHLADMYSREIPGLVDIGRHPLRGRGTRRDPNVIARIGPEFPGPSADRSTPSSRAIDP